MEGPPYSGVCPDKRAEVARNRISLNIISTIQ
jgi:hypothetical protein